MKKLFIGTSGWAYNHWQNIFYPENLAGKDRLKYFSQHFKTTEINYSFYRLPTHVTYQNWYEQTPENFIFAVKTSRFITHIKRLKGAKPAWKTFLKNALNLKEKLGPFLFQFPANFSATDENIKRLKEFLKIIVKYKARFAFEFRHKSWCAQEIYKILKKYNCAWVIADSPNYPKAEKITADFVYIRMHGSKVLFSSKYTKKELENLAQKIKKWLKQKDVFVYFNNDAMGYAIENAKTLKNLCH
ncbi:hypothetical protein AMJ49_06810 [Parcubacteria bacterium DG_74_2]|nr:MAG: hypothetical protein AMJ49_06810 [Parcubacteria bacterium DG_74_2]